MLQESSSELRAALSPAVLIAGSVHVIDLAAIREGSGGVWDKIKDGLHARLECILRQRLAASDFFSAVGDTRYMVVTPRANAEESAIICLRVLHELTTNLFGACAHDQICIERAYEGDNGTLRSERFSRAAIAHLAAKAQLSGLEQETLEAAETFAAPALAPELKRDITYRFEPVWDARHEAITTYICTPEFEIAEDEVPLTPKERMRIELSALSAGAEFLNRHLENGERFLLGVKLSFETLGSPHGRMEIAGLCRNLPAQCRQYLMFLITDIPAGVAHSRLTDFVMTLSHFGRIVATVASGTRNLSAYQGLGLFGIACDLGAAHLDNERIATDIAQLAAAGRNLRLVTVAYGVRSRSTLALAHGAGIQVIHGDPIGPAREAPRPMTRLNWSEIAPAKRRVQTFAFAQALAVA
jgi:EAL domain-containing protein (putative c-di-GMP-specific phosphodiesterase class I)